MGKLLIPLALLLGALLISGGVVFWFEITFAAITAGLLGILQKLKLFALLDWVFRVTILKMPQRFITKLLRRYAGDHVIIDWLKASVIWLKESWVARFQNRLFIVVILAGIATLFTTTLGLLILLIFGLDELIGFFWRIVWPLLSETAMVQAVSSIYVRLKQTQIGRFLIAVDHWLDTHISYRIERAGLEHKRILQRNLEEVLTYQLKTRLQQPIERKVRHHEHLLDGVQVRKFQRESKKPLRNRRKQTRPSPRPR